MFLGFLFCLLTFLFLYLQGWWMNAGLLACWAILCPWITPTDSTPFSTTTLIQAYFLAVFLTWDSVLKNSINKARCSIPQILPKGMNKSVLSSLSSNFNFLNICLRRAGNTCKCCMTMWTSVYKPVETRAQKMGVFLYCSPCYFWKRQLSPTANQ